MRTMLGSAAALLAASLSLAACDGGDASDDWADDISVPRDEAPDEPESAPEPGLGIDREAELAEKEREDLIAEAEPEREEDEFAVPDDVDNDYVDQVVNELLVEDGRILKGILARDPGDGLKPDEIDLLASIYSGLRFQDFREDYEEYARSLEERDGFLEADVVGRVHWSSELVVHSEQSCIISIGEYDLSRVADNPFSDDLRFAVSLARSPGSNDIGWTMHDLNALADSAGEPVNPDFWLDLDYSSFLVDTCQEFES
jgi:hypothetical protein